MTAATRYRPRRLRQVRGGVHGAGLSAPRLSAPREAHLRQHLGMDLRLADWTENSRIKTIAAIVAGDEIHAVGDYNLFQPTPLATCHRRLCVCEFLTGGRGHDDIACAIAHRVARHRNNPLHILCVCGKDEATKRSCGETNGNDVAACRLKQLFRKRRRNQDVLVVKRWHH